MRQHASYLTEKTDARCIFDALFLLLSLLPHPSVSLRKRMHAASMAHSYSLTPSLSLSPPLLALSLTEETGACCIFGALLERFYADSGDGKRHQQH